MSIDKIDWDNKPKLKHKWLSVVFILFGCVVFYYVYLYASQIIIKHNKANNSIIDIQALSRDLVDLKTAPLDSLKLNQKKLDLIYNFGLGDVEVRYPEADEKKKQSSVVHSDNIGNFYRIEVVFFGDMYEQMYFLSKFDKLRNFVMIDSLNANQRNVIIKARLYGQ